MKLAELLAELAQPPDPDDLLVAFGAFLYARILGRRRLELLELLELRARQLAAQTERST